jgi:retron-type reverse transcriptase
MTPKPFDIPKALVWEAFQNVKDNDGAAGIDQQTIEQFEERLGDNLYKLWNRMCSGSYFPPPVKAVPIPKKTRGVRVLGVPTVADRVAQTVVKLWLEPILCFTRTPTAIGPAGQRMTRSPSPNAGAGSLIGLSNSTSKACSTISITIS